MELKLSVIEARINSLETRAKSENKQEFMDAVASFRNFISLSSFPQDLKDSFLNIKAFSTQQGYIDLLRGVLKNYRTKLLTHAAGAVEAAGAVQGGHGKQETRQH